MQNCEIMQKKYLAKLEKSLRKDIAKAHRVSPSEVYIRMTVAGNIAVNISLPEPMLVNPKIAQVNSFPNFKSIMNANGINDYRIKRDTMSPDPVKAKEILMNYVRHVVI